MSIIILDYCCYQLAKQKTWQKIVNFIYTSILQPLAVCFVPLMHICIRIFFSQIYLLKYPILLYFQSCHYCCFLLISVVVVKMRIQNIFFCTLKPLAFHVSSRGCNEIFFNNCLLFSPNIM